MTKLLCWSVPVVLFTILALLNIPICPARVIFGLCCPGCGLTRGTLALLHGDLAEMVRFHPLAFILSPLMAWMLTHGALVSLKRLSPNTRLNLSKTLPRPVWLGIAVLLFGVWIARASGLISPLPNPLFDPEQSLVFGGKWPDG